MESFVFHDDILCLIQDANGIPKHTYKDYTVDTHDVAHSDMFIEPGIVIEQHKGLLKCTYTDKRPYFSFKQHIPLEHLRIHGNTCYGSDSNGNVHIISFEDSTSRVVDLGNSPQGWCIVPKTSSILHWSVLSLVVTNTQTEKHKSLRGHYSKILCGDATNVVAVTGDRSGHICIWYVASWSCHHYIQTGGSQCQQIQIKNSDYVAVRNNEAIIVYNIAAGKTMYNVRGPAKDMKWCSTGLVITNGRQISLHNDGIVLTLIQDVASKFVGASHNYVWASIDGKWRQLQFDGATIGWANDFLQWVHAPIFPCPCRHWPHRYMDILAISVKQWVPLVSKWHPPKIWFRHTTLRNAIWDTVLELGCIHAASSWQYLHTETMREWYAKCDQKLHILCRNEEYTQNTLRLLQHSYKHICLSESENDTIIQWCWQHHGKMELRPIIMYLTDHDFDGIAITCISKLPPSQDSILCFTATGANLAIRNGWFHLFIDWFKMYHQFYPHAPQQHMRQIFTSLLLYIYKEIDTDNLHLPLRHTGTFKKLTRVLPSHKHAYIRLGRRKGFITRVHEHDTKWWPLDTATPISLNVDDAQIWQYHQENVPHTMLENALTLLDCDIWSYTKRKKSFKWFSSETGSFLAIKRQVTANGNTINICKAGKKNGHRYIVGEAGNEITDEHLCEIEWTADTWSYLDENAYSIIPLQLKICHLISMSARTLPTQIMFAEELLSCLTPRVVQKEHIWSLESCVTAMLSDSNNIFIGLNNGIIYEYINMATLENVHRTFEHHKDPILQMHIVDSRLVSMSNQQICIWDTRCATKYMYIDTQNTFLAILPSSTHSLWVIEQSKSNTGQLHTLLITEWNLTHKVPIHTLDASSFQTDTLPLSCNRPILLIGKNLHLLENSHTIQLHIEEDISCIAHGQGATYGGTVHGRLFKINHSTEHLETWDSLETSSVSAIATIPQTNIIVSGYTMGYILVHDSGTEIARIRVSNAPIHCLLSESLFSLVACQRKLYLLAIMPEKFILSVHAMSSIIAWSDAWKSRALLKSETIIQPAIITCLNENIATRAALELLDTCTEDYQRRAIWCSTEMIDSLLGCYATETADIIRRLVHFRGPRFECAICADEEINDPICYLTPCKHRFHCGCVQQLIKKTPEYHQELQYDYALSFTLRCPICRKPFTENDVAEDTLLNKYLYIPYATIHHGAKS